MIRVFLIVALAVCISANAGLEAGLYIPGSKAKSGNILELVIRIDQADRLAGVKLKVRYDESVLAYIGGEKTPQASSLMSVVNEKISGELIIVMAGAKGISGKDLGLFTLRFKASEAVKKKASAGIQIHEVQLMSDQLKEIECEVRVGEILVYP